MSRDGRAIIVAGVAVLLLRLSLTDQYLQYVKASMRPWLVISGLLLAALALYDIVASWRADEAAPPSDADEASALGHDHGSGGCGGDEVETEHVHGLLPWALLVPFVVVFAVGPSPLGSYMADRQPTRYTDAIAAGELDGGDLGGGLDPASYPGLPPAVDGVVELRIDEFVSRALLDPNRSMDGALIRVVGFVTSDDSGDGNSFRLARFKLSCCAADGFAIALRILDADQRPANDTWLAVEGYWVPPEGTAEIEEFRAVTITEIEEPSNPYL